MALGLKARLPNALNIFAFLAVLAFILSLVFLSQVQMGLLVLAAASLVLSAVIYYRMSLREKQEYAFEWWAFHRDWSKLQVDPSFELVKGEKVIFPMTTCYVRMKSAYTWKYYARDVIVTNKRILLGFLTSLLLVNKETFGQANFWSPGLKKVPISSPMTGFLGGNSRIREISYGSEDGIPFLRFEVDYPLPNSITIYHPRSAEIYALFQRGG